MKHIPRKRFGQHFLSDRLIIDAIVDEINPQPGDPMVEIGPGLAALTVPLLECLDHLHVIEIDRDLVQRLRVTHPADRLTVHEGDALDFDLACLPAPIRVVGNLPYNISTPILFHLLQQAERIVDMHFMLQREVVERMAAAPGSRQYGRLSVMVQHRCEVQCLFGVPPQAFTPPPAVDSAIVRPSSTRTGKRPNGHSAPRSSAAPGSSRCRQVKGISFSQSAISTFWQ